MIDKRIKITQSDLLTTILMAIEKLEGWGSVEIFVQNGKVTQITQKAIKKIESIV